MRNTHRHSPFHRIECWTGDSYRRAALWEVGTYILAPHNGPAPICPGLAFQKQYLEGLQTDNDDLEQVKLGHLTQRWSMSSPGAPAPASATGQDMHMAEEADSGEPETWEQEVLSDAEFQNWLDSLHDDSAEDEFMDGEDAEDGERGTSSYHLHDVITVATVSNLHQLP